MLNNFIGIGRIVKNAELQTKGEQFYSRFTIAINSKGEEEEYVEFIPCVIFGKYAQSLNPYLEKGKIIAVQGTLHISDYENKEKEKKTSISIICSKVTLLGGPNSKGESDIES